MCNTNKDLQAQCNPEAHTNTTDAPHLLYYPPFVYNWQLYFSIWDWNWLHLEMEMGLADADAFGYLQSCL